jgi:hypothetical protein
MGNEVNYARLVEHRLRNERDDVTVIDSLIYVRTPHLELDVSRKLPDNDSHRLNQWYIYDPENCMAYNWRCEADIVSNPDLLDRIRGTYEASDLCMQNDRIMIVQKAIERAMAKSEQVKQAKAQQSRLPLMKYKPLELF